MSSLMGDLVYGVPVQSTVVYIIGGSLHWVVYAIRISVKIAVIRVWKPYEPPGNILEQQVFIQSIVSSEQRTDSLPCEPVS